MRDCLIDEISEYIAAHLSSLSFQTVLRVDLENAQRRLRFSLPEFLHGPVGTLDCH
jgi:hypothetical protein